MIWSLAWLEDWGKIDFNQAYHQMHVDEKSEELLMIVTHRGLYRYCRLPFGITLAPALFQCAMDQILSWLSGVQCYLDDILVTGETEEEHLRPHWSDWKSMDSECAYPSVSFSSPQWNIWCMLSILMAYTMPYPKSKQFQKHQSHKMWVSYALILDFSTIMEGSYITCLQRSNHFISYCAMTKPGNGQSNMSKHSHKDSIARIWRSDTFWPKSALTARMRCFPLWAQSSCFTHNAQWRRLCLVSESSTNNFLEGSLFS